MAYWADRAATGRINSIKWQQDHFRVPIEVNQCTLDDWRGTTYFDLAVKYLADYPVARSPRGLYLWSPDSGNGKSSLCVTICRELIRMGKTRYNCFFYPSADLFEELRILHNAGERLRDTAFFQRVMKSDVVIFDDMGLEKLSQFAANRYMALMGPLWDEGKHIMITSKFNLGSLMNRAEPNVDTEILGSIADRINDMCQIIRYDMPRFRGQSKH